jgi:hypothetical protein
MNIKDSVMKTHLMHRLILFISMVLLLMIFAAGCADKTPAGDKPAATVKAQVMEVKVENKPVKLWGKLHASRFRKEIG